jgi:hypothetical protein
MALFKEIPSPILGKEEKAYYHKIKEVTIVAINPTKQEIDLGKFHHQYAVTIKVNSFSSQSEKGIEATPMFSKYYSLTLTADSLEQGAIMNILYDALKQEEDFLGAEDV